MTDLANISSMKALAYTIYVQNTMGKQKVCGFDIDYVFLM